MNKRAQVTIFVIIALVLIVAVTVIYLIVPQKNLEDQDSSGISTFVQDCLEKTAEEVIFTVSKGGGHFLPPNESTSGGIAYYLYEEENLFPKKEEIEKEISKYVSENLFLCLDGFKKFEGLNITEGEPKISSSIRDREISFKADFPLTILKGGSTVVLKEFVFKVDSNLGRLYGAVKELVDGQEESKSVCLNCQLKLFDEGYKVEMSEQEKNTIVFSLKEVDSSSNLEWLFANEY